MTIVVRYPDLFAGVLVGGRGTRMGGRDKARLRRPDGTTFLEHIDAALRGVVTQTVLAAGPDHSFGDTGCRVVVDRFAGAGPLAGLEVLLADPPASWCLLLACDLPYFDPAIVEPLVAARDHVARIVVPRTADGLQPTCALYEAGLHDSICDMLSRGQYRLVDLLASVGCREVPLSPELSATLVNVNRVEDWPAAAKS